MRVHSGGYALIESIVGVFERYCDDRNTPTVNTALLEIADDASRLETVDIRKPAVHQDDVECLRFDRVDCLVTRRDRRPRKTERCQLFESDESIHGIVLDNEHAAHYKCRQRCANTQCVDLELDIKRNRVIRDRMH
jgi:hypothetical protein